MYKIILAAALLAFNAGANAQTSKEQKEMEKAEKELKRSQKEFEKSQKEYDKALKEYDEIVIKKKTADDIDSKIVIEIQDDKVLVDGKPIDDYVNDELSVRLRSPKRIQLNTDSRFRFPEGWNEDGEERAFLGVSTEGSKEGAKIVNVSENSAAAKAGLKNGDIIKKINDKDVYDHEQVTEVIAGLKPDAKVTIVYLRDGKENKTTATLGKRKNDVLMRFGPEGAPVPPMPPMAPMPPMQFDFDGGNGNFHRFFDLRGASKPRLGIKAQDTEDGKGVKVLEVEDESAAEKAGIKEDDIITSFDGKEVNNAEELAKASRESKDKSSLKIQLKRNGKSQTVEIKVPKKLKTAEL